MYAKTASGATTQSLRRGIGVSIHAPVKGATTGIAINVDGFVGMELTA